MPDIICKSNNTQIFLRYIFTDNPGLLYCTALQANLQEEQGMSGVECGDNDAQEANHSHTAIDELSIAREEVIALSGDTLEDWDGCGKGEGEEGQDDGDGGSLELFKYVEASGKLSA